MNGPLHILIFTRHFGVVEVCIQRLESLKSLGAVVSSIGVIVHFSSLVTRGTLRRSLFFYISIICS